LVTFLLKTPLTQHVPPLLPSFHFSFILFTNPYLSRFCARG
jgi:hypothetical protein